MALNKGTKSDLGSLLADFRVKEPDRWLSLLLLNDVLPAPDNPTFPKVISKLTDVLLEANSGSGFHGDKDATALPGLLSIHTCLSSITEELDQLGIWQKPGIAPVVTTAAFVEDQWDYIVREVNGGYVNRCVNDIRRRPSQPLIQWRFHPHTVHRGRRLRSTQGPSDA